MEVLCIRDRQHAKWKDGVEEYVRERCETGTTRLQKEKTM